MFNLVKKIIYTFCFCLLISNSYGADASSSSAVAKGDPSNFKVPAPVIANQLAGYNASITEWLNTHDEGKQFLSSGYNFPKTMMEFMRGGNKPLEKYKAFYAMQQATKQAQKEGAGGRFKDEMVDAFGAKLGLSRAQIEEEDSNKVMGHIMSAIDDKSAQAKQAEEAKKRADQEEAAKREALQALEENQRREIQLKEKADEMQRRQDELQVHHGALQQAAKDAGVDVGQVALNIDEQLEKMQEANALKNALDSLRFLTYYMHQQQKFEIPKQQLGALNEKAAVLLSLTGIKDILEKGDIKLPINDFDRIPFFDAYDERFNTPEFKILQAWIILQQCPKLKNEDLNKIKKWADAKKQKAKIPQKTTDEINALLKTVVSDVLWGAFKGANQLTYAQTYFWAQLYERYPLERTPFRSIRKESNKYSNFTTLGSLRSYAKDLGENHLLHFAFMVDSIQTEFGEETAAQNFAMLSDLQKSYKDIAKALKVYNASAPVFIADLARAAPIQKLAKRKVGEFPEHLNLLAEGNISFIGSLSLLESWFFCLNQEDPRVVAFNAANAQTCKTINENSGALLREIITFTEILQKYNTECYAKAVALGGKGCPVKLLSGKRDDPPEEKAVEPPTLKKQLQDIVALSDQEKEIVKLEKEIVKTRTIIEKEGNAAGADKYFGEVIAWLRAEKPKYNGAVSEELLCNFYKEALANPDLLDLIKRKAISFLTKFKAFEEIDSDLLMKIIQKYSEGKHEYQRITGGGLVSLHIVAFSRYLFNDGLKALKEMESDLQLRIEPREIHGLLGDMQRAVKGPGLNVWIEKSEVGKKLKKIRNINFRNGTKLVLRLENIEKTYTDQEILRFIETLPKLLTEYSKVAHAAAAQAQGGGAPNREEQIKALLAEIEIYETARDESKPIIDQSTQKEVKGVIKIGQLITGKKLELKKLQEAPAAVQAQGGGGPNPEIQQLEAKIAKYQDAISRKERGEVVKDPDNLVKDLSNIRLGGLKLAISQMQDKLKQLVNVPAAVAQTPLGNLPVMGHLGQVPIPPPPPMMGAFGPAAPMGPLQAPVHEIPYAEKLQALTEEVERLKADQSRLQKQFEVNLQDMQLVRDLKQKSDLLNKKSAELAELKNPPIVLGKSLSIENFMLALEQLMDIVRRSMDNREYLQSLDAEKAKLNVAIPATRKLYLEFANAANAKFADYQKLLVHLNDGIVQFFKAVDLRKYIDSNVSNSNIVKFMNEFLASFEIVLWQKIEAFGEATTKNLKKNASAEINGQKAAFEAGFVDTTLAQLTAEKFISKETLSGITDRVMPLTHTKFSNSAYQAALRGYTADNPIIFDAIIKEYVTKIAAEAAAKIAQKPAFQGRKEDPLLDALKRLRKTENKTINERNMKLAKLLKASQKQISELVNTRNILKHARVYIDTLKAGKNVEQAKEQIEGVSFQGAFYEIRDTCFGAWETRPLSDLLYKFFISVTGDYIAKDAELAGYLANLKSDYEAARKKMDQYPDITVTGILENSSNVLPLIFNEVYAHLTERKDGSHLEFANYVLERFVTEFHPEVSRVVEELIASDANHIKIDDLPADDPNIDPATQLQGKQQLVVAEFDSVVEPYKARYKALDLRDPLVLTQQQQIVIEFIEASEIIDKRAQQAVEKQHKEELQKLMNAPIKDIKFLAADQKTLLSESLDMLDKKLLKEIAAKKLVDKRLAALIDFYNKNPQAKIADILKNLQAEKQYKAEFIGKLEKDFKGSWLASKLEELCKKGQNIVDFENILKELMDMPMEMFLNSFFEIKVQVIAAVPQLIQYIEPDIAQNYAVSPPALIWQIVEQKMKEGMDPEDIVVAFDWDGTVIGKMGADAQDLKEDIRWKTPMLGFLDKLQKAGVHLVIDTASKRSGIHTILIKSAEVGLLKFFGIQGPPKNESDIKTVGKTGAEEDIYQWQNIISGSSGYDKAGYLEHYMQSKRIKPKLIIFTDDAAHNVIGMRDYFAENGVQFVGIHVPQVDLGLPLHQSMLQMLQSKDAAQELQIAAALDKENGEPNQGTNALKIKRELIG